MMKKSVKIIGCLVCMISFLPISFAQEMETEPVKLKKISDRLYEVLGGRGARGGAFIGDNGVLLIDTKMTQESVEQTRGEIQKLTDHPIKYIFNTHSDGDHVRGNRHFPKTVTIVAHENCRQEFFHPRRDGTASEWKKPELAPFIPSLTFRQKMTIYLGSYKVELWYFGVGHTTGDAVVYFPEEKTTFLGDQIFLTRPQLIHAYKGGNSFEYVQTMTNMLNTLDAKWFCSGHSEMADRVTVKDLIDQMKDRQEKVQTLVKQGKNLEQIKCQFEEKEGRLVETIFNEIKKGDL